MSASMIHPSCHSRPSIASAMRGEGNPGGKSKAGLSTWVPFPRARCRSHSPGMTVLLAAILSALTIPAFAQPATAPHMHYEIVINNGQTAPVLIKHGHVYTVGAAGTLNDADVLIVNGKIAQVGPNLSASNAQNHRRARQAGDAGTDGVVDGSRHHRGRSRRRDQRLGAEPGAGQRSVRRRRRDQSELDAHPGRADPRRDALAHRAGRLRRRVLRHRGGHPSRPRLRPHRQAPGPACSPSWSRTAARGRRTRAPTSGPSSARRSTTRANIGRNAAAITVPAAAATSAARASISTRSARSSRAASR